jgi:hypothetical protein
VHTCYQHNTKLIFNPGFSTNTSTFLLLT